MDPAGRYRLTLTVEGRDVVHGWWDRLATGDSRMTDWIGLHGREGARITLTDTETGKTVRAWP